MTDKLVFNRAKCLVCNDILESTHKDHSIVCTCGNLSIGGGQVYLKRSAILVDMVEEMSQWCNNDDCTGCWRECIHKTNKIDP